MSQCDICDMKFVNKSNVNRHKATKHPEEDEQSHHCVTDEEMESDLSENEESGDDSSENEESDQEDFDSYAAKKAVWSIMIKESNDSENSIAEVYKEKILFHHFMKKDQTYQAIMKTLKRFREEEEDIGFEEALNLAVYKRRYLIQKQGENTFVTLNNL